MQQMDISTVRDFCIACGHYHQWDKKKQDLLCTRLQDEYPCKCKLLVRRSFKGSFH